VGRAVEALWQAADRRARASNSGALRRVFTWIVAPWGGALVRPEFSQADYTTGA
jgi:hypothetical protein